MSKDQLTAEYTACETFAELMKKVNNGYTPTLRTKKGTSQQTSKYNTEITELACEIMLAGGKVFFDGVTRKL